VEPVNKKQQKTYSCHVRGSCLLYFRDVKKNYKAKKYYIKDIYLNSALITIGKIHCNIVCLRFMRMTLDDDLHENNVRFLLLPQCPMLA
jgi:hypothetical protein